MHVDKLTYPVYYYYSSVQLVVQLFNEINLWLVQGLKVTCLAGIIIHGYVAIRVREKSRYRLFLYRHVCNLHCSLL